MLRPHLPVFLSLQSLPRPLGLFFKDLLTMHFTVTLALPNRSICRVVHVWLFGLFPLFLVSRRCLTVELTPTILLSVTPFPLHPSHPSLSPFSSSSPLNSLYLNQGKAIAEVGSRM